MVRLVFLMLVLFSISAEASCKAHFSNAAEKYGIPQGILQTVSHIESLKHPWTVNVKGKGYYFRTKEHAIEYVKNLIEKGVTNIDIGCMQINYKYHKSAFKDVNDMFNPQNNIEYAAKFIRTNYGVYQNWRKAVAVFHSKNVEHSAKYIYKFSKNFHTF
ncbi:MAG: transglycosylase SLT domain-containing protein [Alphaproteobacteria bacterium]|jgi:soluble lytic murein transglycosylase-like protein|nr:transglycosylase SLT domain-containing protein [Alphaproteobacteria bacterium]OJV12560.1 MAG: hypothetical protein BGO27_03450 [Alphaproteobacteria bacterium 33-17]